ncbi:MAG: LysR family transcriptional regulator [Coriobacteriales bacterium]|jgi:DNA-binding transcriptional LysR family regulator
MNIEVLEEYVALANTKKYSAVAKKLHTSQPSISRHIAALEEEMGTKLVLRQNPLVLTDAGQTVLEMAEDVLWTVSRTKSKIQRSECSPDTRRIRLQNMFWCHLFANMLREYSSLASKGALPEVENLQISPEKSVCDALLDKDIDIGFVNTFGDPSDNLAPQLPAGLVSSHITQAISPFCLLVRNDSMYATKQDVSLGDLVHLRLLTSTDMYLEEERNEISRMYQKHAGFLPLFDRRQVSGMQEFYTLDPEGSAFVTTENCIHLPGQFSSWVIDNTVPLYPCGKRFIRKIHAVYRDDSDEQIISTVQAIKSLWKINKVHE